MSIFYGTLDSQRPWLCAQICGGSHVLLRRFQFKVFTFAALSHCMALAWTPTHPPIPHLPAFQMLVLW